MTVSRLVPVLLACVLVLFPGAVPGGAQAAEASRIVSAGGAVTEIVHALGMSGRLVGVDTTSLYPPEVRGLPRIGYMRELSAEGIASLDPDLVLLGAGAGPPVVLDQLRALGVDLRVIPDDPSPAGLAAKVEAVGAALGREAEGHALAARLSERVAATGRAVDEMVRADGRPRVLFLMGIGRGSPMTAGERTAADAMIRLAGGVNAMAGYHGYKPASPEAILAAGPDFILVPSDTVEALGGEAAVLALPQIAGTRAAREGRLLSMDALYLLGFGPRLPDAMADLAAMLHPPARAEAGR